MELEDEIGLEGCVVVKMNHPSENRLPILVAGKVVVRDEEAMDALGEIRAHDALAIIRRAVTRLAPLHVDDGAETALIRTASPGVETRVHARGPQNPLPRPQTQRRPS